MKIDKRPGPYGEAWPGGVWNTKPEKNLLHFRVAADARIVGQDHDSFSTWYWRGDKWVDLGGNEGINIAAFHPSNGDVYVSTKDGLRIFNREGSFKKLIGGYIGSNGIRLVKPDGSVVTGDATYANTAIQLGEYTDIGDGVLVGQHGFTLATYANGALRTIAPFDCKFIRVNRVGEDVAIAFANLPSGLNYRVLTTMGELRSLAKVVATPTPPVVVPPPTQEPPKPMPTAPNKIEVVRHVISLHPEINRLKDGERGRITDLVVLELGGRPWGRKDRDRDPSNNNNSDDALCFLLNDGSFEIYDILSGGDGSATFDYKGTFRDGQNGFFRDVVAGASPGPSPSVPGPGPVVGGGTQVDVNALIQAAVNGALEEVERRTAIKFQVLKENDLAALINRLAVLEARLANRIRTTPAGYGPLKHSHEVTI